MDIEGQTITPADDVSAIIGMFRSELPDPTQPFTLLARFRVRDGVHAQVERLFGEARIPTLREPGCVAFEMSRHASDARRFVVYERWKSLADLDAHLRTPYTTKLREAFNALIDGLPEFHVLVAAS